MSHLRFPLEPLQKLAEHQVEVARRELQAARAALDDLLALQAEISAAVGTIIARREAELRDFQLRQQEGLTSVGSARLFAERQVGLQQDETAARGHLGQIEEKLEEARARLEVAQLQLADQLAGHEAIEQQKQQWDQERRQRSERSEWEELEPLTGHLPDSRRKTDHEP
ncbi:MAG: hypothetical protein JW797_00900 [Bradymonadales bacterium]|nr:hypothetical protein [Bradymonadales bacterium]